MFEYPNQDIDGKTIYVNTHFLSKEEAWNTFLKNQIAWMQCANENVIRLESQLQTAKNELVRVTGIYFKAKDEYAKEVANEA